MLRRSRLAVIAAAALALAGGASAPSHADYVGTFVWQQNDDPHFGGFSGFDLAEDGLHFVTVSDTAAIYSGTLSRDARGVVASVTATTPIIPTSRSGQPLVDPMDDAEGLAIGPDGTIFLSYETEDRIVEYRDRGATWVREFAPRDFRRFNLNKGLEALAIDARGAVYAIPELEAATGSPIPVFRLQNETADIPFLLRREGDWLPVGADFGPDGRLYLLERDFWPLIGFMSRVRRITLDGDRVASDEVLLQTGAGVHDNLEGLAVWRDAKGVIRLTMISDDNFLPVQRTEIVDYRVTE